MSDGSGPRPEPEPPWGDFASCRGMDPELFTVSLRCMQGLKDSKAARRRAREAKAVCRTCPVWEECLTEAFAIDDRWMIRGGLTPPERRRLRSASNQPSGARA